MRNTVKVTIQDRGKDLDFEIKEMSASQQESWLIRAGLLLTGKGIQGINDLGNIENMLSLLGGVDYQKAKPLLDELLSCCSLVTTMAGNKKSSVTQLQPSTVDGVIEDVQTLFKLKIEAFKVNFSPLLQGSQSNS